MDFGNLGGIGGSVAGFIATPEGQTAVKNFLATPDGTTLLKNFAATPQGQQIIMSILPSVVDGMNLPEPVKAMIKSSAPTQ
ncbi:hypothetical protein [Methanoregula sp.]|jgi:hypothetical protein|uniref:hypothetical protein n=1 Tax=Methanoregula sp. TaxID=2052170 RepID=UPI0025EF44BC|nr:hypothetical protein [Methanoregula sp.]